MDIKLGTYLHAKSGKKYRVLGMAKHSETLEDLVIYEPLYEGSISKVWVRPVELFTDEVEIDGITQPRFEYLGE